MLLNPEVLAPGDYSAAGSATNVAQILDRIQERVLTLDESDIYAQNNLLEYQR